MNLEIKEIQSREEWEDFINQKSPHTFLQTWEWGLAQEALGYKIFRLGIYGENILRSVALIYKIKARRGSFLFCPHGPITENNLDENLKVLVKYLRKLAQKEKVDFIRFSPLLSEKTKIIFKKLKFKEAPIHMHPELAWILDISLPAENLLRNMKKRTRYSINKAKKDGVTIVKTKNIKEIDKFYQIYQTTAGRQDFVPFSKEYVQKEFKIFLEKNKALLFFAYYRNEIIATAVIIFTNGSGFYHHGASIRKYSGITAAELLQWEAILESQKRGLKLYNFWGIAPEDRPNHPWIGLSRFKKGFGGFSEKYLHAQDLILTPKYFINYIVETIRRIKRKY